MIDRTADLVGAYQHGVQNIYRDGSTTALLRLSDGLFAKRMWQWSTDSVEGWESAPASVTNGVAGLLLLETVAHGLAYLGDLCTWSDGPDGWSNRPGLVLDYTFNKTLLREGLRTFEMMGLKPDVSLVVRIVQAKTGPCLIVSHGVDAIFVMALTNGETSGAPATVERGGALKPNGHADMDLVAFLRAVSLPVTITEKPAPKPRKRRKLKRWIVLEVVSELEAESEEAARERLPVGRTFEVREAGK